MYKLTGCNDAACIWPFNGRLRVLLHCSRVGRSTGWGAVECFPVYLADLPQLRHVLCVAALCKIKAQILTARVSTAMTCSMCLPSPFLTCDSQAASSSRKSSNSSSASSFVALSCSRTASMSTRIGASLGVHFCWRNWKEAGEAASLPTGWEARFDCSAKCSCRNKAAFSDMPPFCPAGPCSLCADVLALMRGAEALVWLRKFIALLFSGPATAFTGPCDETGCLHTQREMQNECGVTINKASLSTGRVAKNGIAAGTGHDGLRVAKDGGNVEAALALDVHEEGVGALDEALLLVLALFGGGRRVEEVDD